MQSDSLSGQATFPLTEWSALGRAGQGQAEALERVLSRYLSALKRHLVRVRKVRPERAEDLVQGFMLERVIRGGLLAKADRDKGRFRTFLLTALQHYVADEVRKERAQKRGGGLGPTVAPDGLECLPAIQDEPAQDFQLVWVKEVVSEALRQMEIECQKKNLPGVWGIFECRLLGPALHETPPLPYDELVARFGFESPSAASNALITAKRIFRRKLLSVVEEYASSRRDAETEMRELKKMLLRFSGGKEQGRV